MIDSFRIALKEYPKTMAILFIALGFFVWSLFFLAKDKSPMSDQDLSVLDACVKEILLIKATGELITYQTARKAGWACDDIKTRQSHEFQAKISSQLRALRINK